jgi:hypothetical protein
VGGSNYLWFAYTGGTASGTVTMVAPGQPGQYEFRYLPQNGYNVVARSAPVTVSGQEAFGITATSTVAKGGALSVTWSAPGGRPASDWIGLFPAGGGGAYVWWKYTGGSASGSETLTAPSQPGQYEFRYYLEGGWNLSATSGTITVQ